MCTSLQFSLNLSNHFIFFFIHVQKNVFQNCDYNIINIVLVVDHFTAAVTKTYYTHA